MQIWPLPPPALSPFMHCIVRMPPSQQTDIDDSCSMFVRQHSSHHCPTFREHIRAYSAISSHPSLSFDRENTHLLSFSTLSIITTPIHSFLWVILALQLWEAWTVQDQGIWELIKWAAFPDLNEPVNPGWNLSLRKRRQMDKNVSLIKSSFH